MARAMTVYLDDVEEEHVDEGKKLSCFNFQMKYGRYAYFCCHRRELRIIEKQNKILNNFKARTDLVM